MWVAPLWCFLFFSFFGVVAARTFYFLSVASGIVVVWGEVEEVGEEVLKRVRNLPMSARRNTCSGERWLFFKDKLVE